MNISMLRKLRVSRSSGALSKNEEIAPLSLTGDVETFLSLAFYNAYPGTMLRYANPRKEQKSHEQQGRLLA